MHDLPLHSHALCLLVLFFQVSFLFRFRFVRLFKRPVNFIGRRVDVFSLP